MEEKQQDNSNIKTIYWAVTVVPILLLNVTPYLNINIPTAIDNDETYRQLLIVFSLVFVLLLAALFSSYKCIIYSEIIPTKVLASCCLLLYLALIVAMVYIIFSGYIG